MITLTNYIQQTFDKLTGTNDVNTGQCVGLIMKYSMDNDVPFWSGNAKDLIKNANSEYLKVIYNDPNDYNQFPLPGDILVFNENMGGGYGHTGLVVAANGRHILLYEQNVPTGNTPTINYYHTYMNIIGWLRIIKNSIPTVTGNDLQACLTAHKDALDAFNQEKALRLEAESKLDSVNQRLSVIQRDCQVEKQAYKDKIIKLLQDTAI
jgi:hypothetical protein